MDELDIERLGGLGGFGMENSRLRSRGTVSLGKLPEADQQVVQDLFSGKSSPKESKMRDGFTYRIVWHSDKGERTIEVPEQLVPQSLTSAVRDTLE
jgi:hypothetical protein